MRQTLLSLDLVTFQKRGLKFSLDLEGTGEQVEGEELVAIDYLIGIMVRSNGKTHNTYHLLPTA